MYDPLNHLKKHSLHEKSKITLDKETELPIKEFDAWDFNQSLSNAHLRLIIQYANKLLIGWRIEIRFRFPKWLIFILVMRLGNKLYKNHKKRELKGDNLERTTD